MSGFHCDQGGTTLLLCYTRFFSLLLSAAAAVKMCGSKKSEQADVIVDKAPVQEQVLGDKTVSNYSLVEFVCGNSDSKIYIFVIFICVCVVLYLL